MVSMQHEPLAIWIGSAVYGAFLASVYPSTFDVVNLLIEISGRRASIMVIAGITGEMAVPALLGLLFDRYGASTFLWINLALCAGSALVSFIHYLIHV
jgi:MFS family permease